MNIDRFEIKDRSQVTVTVAGFLSEKDQYIEWLIDQGFNALESDFVNYDEVTGDFKEDEMGDSLGNELWNGYCNS